MKNKGREALTHGVLKNANGGLIVDRGFWSKYWVVDDNNGAIIDTFWFKTDARIFAGTMRVSDKVISEKEYKKRFNK